MKFQSSVNNSSSSNSKAILNDWNVLSLFLKLSILTVGPDWPIFERSLWEFLLQKKPKYLVTFSSILKNITFLVNFFWKIGLLFNLASDHTWSCQFISLLPNFTKESYLFWLNSVTRLDYFWRSSIKILLQK